jgi:hypothetical protein
MATVTGSYTWVIPDAAVGGYPGPKIPTACTVTELAGYVVGGTDCDFNVEERSACNSAGTNINGSELTADADGVSSTSFTNSGLAQDCFLWLDVSEATAPGDYLCVTVQYSYTV